MICNDCIYYQSDDICSLLQQKMTATDGCSDWDGNKEYEPYDEDEAYEIKERRISWPD